MAIIHWRHKGLKALFETGKTSRIGNQYHRNVLLILELLDSINDPSDCAGVKNFHELKGNRKGTYATHVSGNHVITFTWDGSNVCEVNFEDYH